jgi:hypothetical protein
MTRAWHGHVGLEPLSRGLERLSRGLERLSRGLERLSRGLERLSALLVRSCGCEHARHPQVHLGWCFLGRHVLGLGTAAVVCGQWRGGGEAVGETVWGAARRAAYSFESCCLAAAISPNRADRAA